LPRPHRTKIRGLINGNMFAIEAALFKSSNDFAFRCRLSYSVQDVVNTLPAYPRGEGSIHVANEIPSWSLPIRRDFVKTKL
jgi:hypothetical protein